MHDAYKIALICFFIMVGQVVYAIITTENNQPKFAEAFERTYYACIGVLITYFVMIN